MEAEMDLVVRKTVTVPLSQDAAFRLFTEGIGSWWPVATHSIEESGAVEARMVPGVGGRIFERTAAGELPWGTITDWNPPAGFSTTWHPGYDEALATQLTVRFVPEGLGSTRVELEYRGWAVHGAAAADRVAGYDTGWDTVLGHYVKRAGG